MNAHHLAKVGKLLSSALYVSAAHPVADVEELLFIWAQTRGRYRDANLRACPSSNLSEPFPGFDDSWVGRTSGAVRTRERERTQLSYDSLSHEFTAC